MPPALGKTTSVLGLGPTGSLSLSKTASIMPVMAVKVPSVKIDDMQSFAQSAPPTDNKFAASHQDAPKSQKPSVTELSERSPFSSGPSSKTKGGAAQPTAPTVTGNPFLKNPRSDNPFLNAGANTATQNTNNPIARNLTAG